jgi:hypothetical protein
MKEKDEGIFVNDNEKRGVEGGVGIVRGFGKSEDKIEVREDLEEKRLVGGIGEDLNNGEEKGEGKGKEEGEGEKRKNN